ncbi:hypothetical protein SAMD00019534_036000, partial [Acytostelium subglobosum LB1]|uniref:hypothetical protein n=1 Tax=Acytostelium subglobosum LB1 TaxID=1410327 RepID=UPI000644F8BC
LNRSFKSLRYTVWANSILKQRGLVVNDLMDDFNDGVLLIILMEILTNERIEGTHSTKQRPTNRLHMLNNVQVALQAIERAGINLVNLRPENLVDRHTKMTLSLLGRIISKFHIQLCLNDEDFMDAQSSSSATTSTSDLGQMQTADGPSHPLRSSSARGSQSNLLNALTSSMTTTTTSTSTATKTPREALLRWCRRELEPYGLSVSNFSKAFQNVQLFYALTHSQAQTAIDLDKLNDMDNIDGLKLCFDIAEKTLNIPAMLPPQAIIDGQLDETCVMAYVACFLNLQRGVTTGHSRTWSVGSNNSQAGNTNNNNISGNNNNSGDNNRYKRASLKRVEPPHTPERNLHVYTNGGSNNSSPFSAGNMVMSPSSTSHTPSALGLASVNNKFAIMEILATFSNELQRITREHEEMLNKTAAKLDDRVNRLGDKLDQLEVKISAIKTAAFVVSGGAAGLLSASSGPDSTCSTPPLSALDARNAKSKKDRLGETKEERDERREKRRSRRKEREDRKIKEERHSVSSITQSLSSSSLTELMATATKEDVIRITRVQAMVRGYLARRHFKRAKNRRDVALEILHTEHTYLQSLEVLSKQYLVPLREKSETLGLNVDNIKTLYNNIQVITNINNSLLIKLRERIEARPWHVETQFGDIFFKMCDLLKCYIAYVNQYNRSLNSINEFAKYPALSEYMAATFQRTNQQLRDLIIIPVQRIPRYVLLLEEMVRVTELTHPDRAQLALSLTKMQAIADHVNEKRRDFENVQHVSLLQDAILGFNIMDYASLRYIMEGELQFNLPTASSGSGFGSTLAGVVSGSEHRADHAKSGATVPTVLHVFLFNQMLVVCKYKKGKDSYAKHLFSSTTDRKSKHPKYKFIFKHNLNSDTKLSHNKSEGWFGVDSNSEYRKFVTKTVAEKDMWIQHIQSCITKAAENKMSKVI